MKAFIERTTLLKNWSVVLSKLLELLVNHKISILIIDKSQSTTLILMQVKEIGV
jgi:hypothetical protein